MEYVRVTKDNLEKEHICCAISNNNDVQVASKKEWLKERFDDFLAQGGADSDGKVADYLIQFLSRGFYKIQTEVNGGDFGCSTICTADEQGTTFFGRNYDWEECRAIIVHTV